MSMSARHRIACIRPVAVNRRDRLASTKSAPLSHASYNNTPDQRPPAPASQNLPGKVPFSLSSFHCSTHSEGHRLLYAFW